MTLLAICEKPGFGKGYLIENIWRRSLAMFIEIEFIFLKDFFVVCVT